MRHAIFLSLFLVSSLLNGCAQKSPVYAAQAAPLPIAKAPIPYPYSYPAQEIQTVNPFLKKPAIEKIIVMLDPGHGGDDFGTHSLGKPKYHEKYLNLSTTMMVRNFLQQFGYEVILTRSDDTFISLEQRALFANEQKPRLFVSIHFNSAPSTDAEGIEVFYFRNEEDKSRMIKSKALAQSILDKTIKNTQAKSRGVKHGNYAVIRETTVPAVLIEGGFLTNTEEMDKIKTAPYLKTLALGIAQGIQEYLAKNTILAER